MKRLLVLTGCIFLMLPSSGYTAAGPDPPASPIAALGAYLGVWRGSGKLLNTPYSKAASIGGTTSCSWAPNHGFLVCDQNVYGPGGPGNDLSIYTYDQKKQAYEFFGISRGSMEVRTPKLSVHPGRWVYSSEFKDRSSKQVFTHTVNEWKLPTQVNFRIEYSLDGTHWVLMGSGSSQRVK